MTCMLRPFIGISRLCYLDDVLILSKNIYEHDKHLREVLEAFRKSKLFANPACKVRPLSKEGHLRGTRHLSKWRGDGISPRLLQYAPGLHLRISPSFEDFWVCLLFIGGIATHSANLPCRLRTYSRRTGCLNGQVKARNPLKH